MEKKVTNLKGENIAVIVKTAIDFDGRVNAQLDALAARYPEHLISLFLLPDKETSIEFPDNVVVKEIKLISRRLPKSALWQFFKIIEYALNICLKLILLNPKIVHVHDESSILGALIFKLIKMNTPLIYDDHELKNIPANDVREKLMFYLEKTIFQIAEISIICNERRRRVVNKVFQPKQTVVIENLFYERERNNTDIISQNLLSRMDSIQSTGKKILLHQGVLNKGRNIDLVKSVVERLPKNWVVLFIGIEKGVFKRNFSGIEQSLYGGFVPNNDLNLIWKKSNAVVIFYGNESLNNKYCAPNRLYLALNFGVPCIVNNNFELKQIVNKYQVGVDLDLSNIDNKLHYFFEDYEKILNNSHKQVGKFLFSDKSHPILKVYQDLNL